MSVAARELAGKGRVFAGVGLPTLAVDLAKRTSNPDVELIYESGVCGAHPSAMAEGIADSVVVSGAESVVSMSALFGYVLQGGNVDVGFLGAAQIDRYGSLNTSIIGDWDKPTVRLPGAGGAVEIMPNAGEIFVVMRRHDPSAFPAELDFCTSPSPVRPGRQVTDHASGPRGDEGVHEPRGAVAAGSVRRTRAGQRARGGHCRRRASPDRLGAEGRGRSHGHRPADQRGDSPAPRCDRQGSAVSALTGRPSAERGQNRREDPDRAVLVEGIVAVSALR